MTQREAELLAKIAKAYADGKKIEIWDSLKSQWVLDSDPSFACPINHYRIKPEPKYRPFDNAIECFKEMTKHKPYGWLYDKSSSKFNIILRQIVYISDKGFRLFADSTDRKFESAFNKDQIYFADGAPFGIKEEEES